MTIEFYYQFTLYSILILSLWVFRDLALVLWTRNMKKREIQSRHINHLYIVGIVLLSWSVIIIFIPNVRIWGYSQAELNLINTIWLTILSIPSVIGTILGFILLFYFRDTFTYDRRAISGPTFLIFGNLLNIIFQLTYFALYYVAFPSIFMYELYLIGLVIARVSLLIGFVVLFLYSFHINNDFFIIFNGLFLANSIISLISLVNSLVIYLSY